MGEKKRNNEKRGLLRRLAQAFILTAALILWGQPFINDLVDWLQPEYVATIRVKEQGNEESEESGPVTIYYEGNKEELFLAAREAAGQEWQYHEGEYGVSWTYLTSEVAGAEFSIRSKPHAEYYLCFEENGRNGTVEIVVDDRTQEISLRIGGGSAQLLRVHPFEGISRVSFVRYGTYAGTAVILLVWFLMLLQLGSGRKWLKAAAITPEIAVYLLIIIRALIELRE